jgi:hypothetical protein
MARGLMMKLALFLLIFVLALGFSSAEAKTRESVGKAYSSNGALLYVEKHIETFAQDNLVSLKTRYFKPSEIVPFASLDSNFKEHPYVPEYEFKDSRINRSDGVRHLASENKVIAYAKADGSSKKKEKTFTEQPNLISGQGLYSYFHKNFDELLNMEKPKTVDFLIPMEQAKYKFIVERHSKTKDKVTYRVKFNNWFIRLFAPYIEVMYSIKDKRLLQYRGPSNIPSLKEDMDSVVIKYKNEDT